MQVSLIVGQGGLKIGVNIHIGHKIDLQALTTLFRKQRWKQNPSFA